MLRSEYYVDYILYNILICFLDSPSEKELSWEPLTESTELLATEREITEETSEEEEDGNDSIAESIPSSTDEALVTSHAVSKRAPLSSISECNLDQLDFGKPGMKYNKFDDEY